MCDTVTVTLLLIWTGPHVCHIGEEKRRVPYPENGLNVSVWDPEASPGLQSSACIICPFISIPFQLFKKAGANVANIVFSWLNWTKKRPNMLELFFSPSSRIPAPLDSSFQRNPKLSCPLIVASAWLKTVTVPSSLVHIFLFFFPSDLNHSVVSLRIFYKNCWGGLVRCAYFESNAVSWKCITETLVTNEPRVKNAFNITTQKIVKINSCGVELLMVKSTVV